MFERFTLIAGPCVLEDDALNLTVARALARIGAELDLPVVFKASFDKANRARPDAPRGPGLEEGLRRLARVRDATGLDLLTDVHEPEQAAAAAEVVDVLQVPAFLSRQTDLIVAAASTGRAVNLKKGQWMAPEEMAGAVAKARAAGAAAVLVTERGTFFGYGDLVVDMRGFERMRAACRCPIVFDGTHSVQRPGRDDGASGGDRKHIETLVLAAVAAGCDALFVEVHPRPEVAPSDGATMLPLDRLAPLLERVLAVRQALALSGLADAGRSRLTDTDSSVPDQRPASGSPRALVPERARSVRLVIFDIDGVLTDAGVYVGVSPDGRPLELKRFDIQDGLGIKLLQRAGIHVAFVSGRPSEANRLRAEELGVREWHQDAEARKVPIVEGILARTGASWDETAMLADDLPDLAVFRRVGLRAAVANAQPEIVALAHWRSDARGGSGAAREFCRALLSARGEWDRLVEEYERERS